MTNATRVRRLEMQRAAAESVGIAEGLGAAIQAYGADPQSAQRRFRIQAESFIDEIEGSEQAGIRPSSLEMRLNGAYRRSLLEVPNA